MEFLIALASQTNSANSEAVKLSDCNLQSSIDGPLQYSQADGFYAAITSHAALSNEIASVFWDGFGVIAGKAFSTSKPNLNCTSELEYYLIDDANSRAAGVFCALSISPANKKFTLKLDPLNQYTVFLYQQDGHFIVSNNVHLMEEYCQKTKIPLTRTLKSAVFEAGLGFGAWDNTGFEEFSTLPFGYKIPGVNARANLVLNCDSLISDATAQSYPELLQEAASDLQNYLRAWREYLKGDAVVFDVTGGIDSRLTLAAAMSIGWDDIGTFCTPDMSDDHLISNMICDRLNLPFANFPQNFEGEEITHIDLVKRAVFRQQGFSTIYNFELGRARVDGVARVRGGYGEITRSFFSPTLSKTSHLTELSRNLHRTIKGDPILWGGLKSGAFMDGNVFAASRLANRIRGQQQFFTEDFKTKIIPIILGQFEELQSLSTPDDFLAESYYLADRAKRHFGYTAQQLNRVRPSIEPLCLPSIWKAANALDKETRSKATLAYDLFEALGQNELRDMPFQAASWPKGMMMNDYHRSGDSVKLASLKKMMIRSVEDPIIELSSSQKGLTGHAYYIAPLLDYLQELVNSLDSHHSCWDYIERDYLQNELCATNTETLSSRKSGLLMRLLHGFVWYASEESPVGISKKLPTD